MHKNSRTTSTCSLHGQVIAFCSSWNFVRSLDLFLHSWPLAVVIDCTTALAPGIIAMPTRRCGNPLTNSSQTRAFLQLTILIRAPKFRVQLHLLAGHAGWKRSANAMDHAVVTYQYLVLSRAVHWSLETFQSPSQFNSNFQTWIAQLRL